MTVMIMIVNTRTITPSTPIVAFAQSGIGGSSVVDGGHVVIPFPSPGQQNSDNDNNYYATVLCHNNCCIPSTAIK